MDGWMDGKMKIKESEGEVGQRKSKNTGSTIVKKNKKQTIIADVKKLEAK